MGLAQPLTKLWIILSEPCEVPCLQPTYPLTFAGVGPMQLVNSILFHKKRVIKNSIPKCGVRELRRNAKD